MFQLQRQHCFCLYFLRCGSPFVLHPSLPCFSLQRSPSTVAFAELSDSSKPRLFLDFLFDLGNFLCVVQRFGALAISQSSVLAVTNVFDRSVSELVQLLQLCLTSLTLRVPGLSFSRSSPHLLPHRVFVAHQHILVSALQLKLVIQPIAMISQALLFVSTEIGTFAFFVYQRVLKQQVRSHFL